MAQRQDTPLPIARPRRISCVLSLAAGFALLLACIGFSSARAICYKVYISTPYWTTERTTRHEVVWHGRRVSTVAVL